MSNETSPAALTVAMCDIQGLVDGLHDNNPGTGWWFHPGSGDVRISGEMSDGFDDEALEDQGWVIIGSGSTRDAFADMSIFAEAVGDIRARDLLIRSLEGKGAFRRFRDTMREFPALKDPWLKWSEAREEARAIRWLLDEGHVGDADANDELVARRADGQAAIDEVSGRHSSQFAMADVPANWDQITALLDAGESVGLTRDGTVFALLTVYEPPM